VTLPIVSYEAERNFSELLVIKNKFFPTMLEERLNYLSFLFRESSITLLLFYDEAVKEYAAKKIRIKNIIELYQAVNYLFFVDFLCL
jgi:hypothetical protein